LGLSEDKAMKIVKVCWEDSSSEDAFVPMGSEAMNTIDVFDVQTIGFLIHQDERLIRLAMEVYSREANGIVKHIVAIPVRSMTKPPEELAVIPSNWTGQACGDD